MFLLAVVFLVALVFHLSVNLAAVKDRQTRLVQEIALLRAEAPQPPGHDHGADLRLASHAEPLA